MNVISTGHSIKSSVHLYSPTKSLLLSSSSVVKSSQSLTTSLNSLPFCYTTCNKSTFTFTNAQQWSAPPEYLSMTPPRKKVNIEHWNYLDGSNHAGTKYGNSYACLNSQSARHYPDPSLYGSAANSTPFTFADKNLVEQSRRYDLFEST